MEIFIYHTNYFSIPPVDLPDVGQLLVCYDPKNRLKSETNPITWAVVRTISNKGYVPPEILGLFWDKEYAIQFAGAIKD